jgi:hypothetical protein
MSYTYIRMTRCSVGRATQKNTRSGGGADFSDILESKGDIIYADANVDADNLTTNGSVIGDVLTIVAPGTLGWRNVTVNSAPGTIIGNLQGVTDNGAATDIEVLFANPTTSFTTSSNAVIQGNVTALSFLGDGTKLTGTALSSDLNSNVMRISSLEQSVSSNSHRVNILEQSSSDMEIDITSNSSRISDLESATIISNSVSINSGFLAGDLIYASANNTLDRFSIGGANQVLKAVNGFPSWQPELIKDWSSDGDKLYYTKGPVGISNVNELTNQTLQIGSNVVINDSDINTVLVSGNIYVSKNLNVIDEISCNKITAAEDLIIKRIVIEANPPRSGNQTIFE